MPMQNRKDMIHSSINHPSHMDICSILGLSRQSTFSEIKHAYEAQRAELLLAEARNDIETALLQEKMQMLEDAFACYSSIQQPMGLITKPDFKTSGAKRRTYTTYSFYIPCVFALLSRCADGAMNWLGACLSGETNDEPCAEGCFSHMFGCSCIRFTDTVIAVAAIIVSLVWAIRKLVPGVKPFRENNRQKRSDKKQEKIKNAFEKRYQAEYYPKLDQLHSNWMQLREYNLDVLPFLRRIQSRKTTDAVDSDFDQMIVSTENGYRRLEGLWQTFCDYRRELSNDKNSEFYRYMRDDSPDRNKYHEMFRESYAPWKAQG